MGRDLLRIEANERIDIIDFEHAFDGGLQENLRQPNEVFLMDPNGSKAFVIGGFEMSNPSGKQLQVDIGRAFLGQRDGALVNFGTLVSEGDATKTIDMSSISLTTYNVYVRFEYVDGDSGSRIFWNPAGSGSELAQTVATRRLANWSVRVETSNPGAEWLKIGTADNTGVGLVIVDQRPLYFEGEVHNSYQSGWSTEGGGSANDRNADRQQYGVTDLQTFTAAMRQCVEDIRGRGLRRWWEKGIGGMNVGFDDDPVEDRVAVGDDEFYLTHDGTNGIINFDTDDRLWFDRSLDHFDLEVGGSSVLQIASDRMDYYGTLGMYISGGLSLSASDAPEDAKVIINTNFVIAGNAPVPTIYFDRADDDRLIYNSDTYGFLVAGASAMDVSASSVEVAGDLFVGGNDLYFGGSGSNDRFNFNDSTNDLNLYLDGIAEWTWDSGQLDCHGNNIFGAGDITGSSLNTGTGYVTCGRLQFDSNDYIDTSDNTYMYFVVNSSAEMYLRSTGLNVVNGLYVGSSTGDAGDNNIYAQGDISCGGNFSTTSGTVTSTRSYHTAVTTSTAAGLDMCQANASNAVLARSVITGAGAVFGGYNVSSASYGGSGFYSVTLLRDVEYNNGYASLISSVNYLQPTSRIFSLTSLLAGKNSISARQTYKLTGSTTVSTDSQEWQFVVIGQPDGI